MQHNLCTELVYHLNHTALMSLNSWFSLSGYVHHLFVVRLMNLLPENLTMI